VFVARYGGKVPDDDVEIAFPATVQVLRS